jgi:hypothetical protein
MTVIASFLAGSLLSLLLPVGLLIAIVIWHMSAVRRVPETPPRTPDVTSLQTGAAKEDAVAPDPE